MSAESEVSARDILKLLQLGKTVTIRVATPVEFSNLRSRLATLKSKEDEIATGIGLYEDGEVPSLNCECRPVHLGYECTFRFGTRPETKKYSIVAVD